MWMGNISSLEHIVMAKNHFEGPIPIELCKLLDLRFLDLFDNNLFGYVPSASIPQVSPFSNEIKIY